MPSRHHIEGLESAESAECRVYWDYYGPSANGTATHFHHHLGEWLERESLRSEVINSGVEEINAKHSVVFCETTMATGAVMYRQLRAHRAIKLPKDQDSNQ